MSTQKETHLILVGFSCSVRPDADQFIPEFSVPSNVTRQETIDKHLATKREEWLRMAPLTPYLGKLDVVCLLDTGKGDILIADNDNTAQSSHVGRRAPMCDTNLPLSHRVANWLTDRYHWDANPFRAERVPEAIFAGFDPRVFLKLLAAQCGQETEPGTVNPMPASIWYDNQDHRDIYNAMIPSEFQSRVSFEVACNRLGLAPPADYAPHNNPLIDVSLAAQAAMRLGLLLDSSMSRCSEALDRLDKVAQSLLVSG